MFRSIDIELNTNCDLRCGYCPNKDNYRGEHYMDDNIFRKIVDELSDMNFDGRVTPSLYGEPMINSKVVEKILYLAKKLPHAKIVVYTNGTHLTQLYYDILEKYVHQFRVTIHSDYTIKAKGDKIYERSFNSNSTLANRTGLVDHPQTKAHHKACWGLTNQAFVNYKGDFLICCNDFMGQEPFGNVKENTLKELYNGSKIKKVRDEMKNNIFNLDICKRCNHVNY